jgi:hypothetical protein
VHHFPQAVIALLRFHRMWPQNNEYVTVCEMLKTILLYCPTTWFGFATGAHVFVQYLSKLEICRNISPKFSEVVLSNTNIDFTESIVELFIGIFLSYLFLLYFKQVNEIVDFTKDLENFRQFGEPENLEQFIHLLGWLVTLGLLSNSGQTLIDEVFLLSVIKNRILTVLIIEYFKISSTLFLKLVGIRCRIEFIHKDDDDEVTNVAWRQSRNF